MMTESEYRSLSNEKYFSYSFIKSFDEYGPKILVNPKKIDNSGIVFGSVVDCLAFSPDEFEKIYYVSETEKELTATEIKLYKHILNNIDIDLINEDLLEEEIFIDTCLEYIKELKLWNNITNKEILVNKITNNFKKHLLEYTISDSKKIISSQTFLDAKYTYKILKEHDFTSEYFSSKDIKEKQVLFQIPILYKINDDNFKSLLDIILVNHKNKTITAVDLKTGAKENKYFKSEFFKRRYDFQAFLYTRALEEYILINGLKNYTINNPIYIYSCRSNPDKPLPFLINRSVVENAYTGFVTHSGKEYKGIQGIIQEIKWHRSNNLYDYTMEEYVNKFSSIDSNIVSRTLLPLDNNIFTNYSHRNSINDFDTAYERVMNSMYDNVRTTIEARERDIITEDPVWRTIIRGSSEPGI